MTNKVKFIKTYKVKESELTDYLNNLEDLNTYFNESKTYDLLNIEALTSETLDKLSKILLHNKSIKVNAYYTKWKKHLENFAKEVIEYTHEIEKNDFKPLEIKVNNLKDLPKLTVEEKRMQIDYIANKHPELVETINKYLNIETITLDELLNYLFFKILV